MLQYLAPRRDVGSFPFLGPAPRPSETLHGPVEGSAEGLVGEAAEEHCQASDDHCAQLHCNTGQCAAAPQWSISGIRFFYTHNISMHRVWCIKGVQVLRNPVAAAIIRSFPLSLRPCSTTSAPTPRASRTDSVCSSSSYCTSRSWPSRRSPYGGMSVCCTSGRGRLDCTTHLPTLLL